jgi:hypothetical protein
MQVGGETVTQDQLAYKLPMLVSPASALSAAGKYRFNLD